MKITTQQIFDKSIIDSLNLDYLSDIGYQIIIGEDLYPYTNHYIERGDEKIFQTIYPVELLVKVTKLIPTSEGRLSSFDIQVGDERHRQETLELSVNNG